MAATLRERHFDLELPHRRGSVADFPDTEDEALTAYLRAALAELFSSSVEPPPCGWCGSDQTSLWSTKSRGRPYPTFQCDACGRCFNRMTGTPLARLHQRHTLDGFLPYLSQQRSFSSICGDGTLFPHRVARWTALLRKWLLELDPSGYWEAKVRLGIRPPDPEMTCPRCGHHGPARPRGWQRSRATLRKPRVEAGRQFNCAACGLGLIDTGDRLISAPAEVPTRTYSEPHAGVRPKRRSAM